MPNVNNITLSLDGNREVYWAGDTVSGVWTLDLGDSFSVRGVRTALIGAAYTRWTPWEDITLVSRKDDKISHEKITTQWKTVFGKKLGEDGPNPTIAAGVYQYRFSFRLPVEAVPSSFEGAYGAIRYWVQLQIDRPLLKFNTDKYKMITVLDRIDVNSPEFSLPVELKTEKRISKALGLGDKGSVSLYAQTDRGAYCPGEKILVCLSANNESDKDLGIVKAAVVQVVKFVASDAEKTYEYVLRTARGDPLLKKSKINWRNQRIPVDPIPPTTRERTSHIVIVSYFVKVSVEVSILKGGNINLYIPITIGTIPQGCQSSLQSSPISITTRIAEMDLSSIITHAQCTMGFECFDECGDEFPRENYIPWCTYVPNFQVKPKPNTFGIHGATASIGPPPSYSAATASKHFTGTASKTAFVMIRFAKSHTQGLQSKLKETKGNLDALGGLIVAFSTNIKCMHGEWPSDTAVAIFLFETKEGGKQWFDAFNVNCRLAGLAVIDSIVGATKEPWQIDKTIFHLNLSLVTADVKGNEWKRYATLSCQQLVPIRQEKGGVLLITTRLLNHLQGSWPPPRYTLLLYQWNTVASLNEYEERIQSNDTYKEVDFLRRKLLPIETDILFETEDLTFIDKPIA